MSDVIKQSDEYYMLQAIALGEKARLVSRPNPWVGAIIVKNGHIIGRGFTSAVGGNHAEINALNEAGENAENATIYVTLEPCSHHGKTPPCVEALIKAKLKRVVIALKDPDEKVSGNGIKKLEEANIPYTLGICEAQAFNSLEAYLHHRTTGKPYVVAKSAISVDGRTAASDGSSKWISNEQSRQDAHYLRLHSQGILIGSGTALKDQPTLNVRGIEVAKQPLRVIFDTKGVVPASGSLFDQSIAKTLIFTSANCDPKILESWKAAGVDFEIIQTTKDGKIDINEALIILGKKGILQLLVEGGCTLLGNFLEKKAIDRLVLYMSPKILGDLGIPLFKNCSIATINEAKNLKLLNIKQLDSCLRLDYQVIK